MIKKIISSIQMTGRVLKNLLLRPFRIINNKLTHLFSGGRVATALPGMVKKLPKLLKTKPEKVEDYFDWGSIYVAKSLVVIVVILLILIPLLYIFLLHPLLTSWFWVKDFYTGDTALVTYDGKVRVYYDEDFTVLQFEGKLDDGKPVKTGTAYYENGRLHYDGEFDEGAFNGTGVLYYEDGSVKYRGSFADGHYSGAGQLNENGKVFAGSFEKGKLQGSGTITVKDKLFYEGAFVDGVQEGIGKQFYNDGMIQYSGSFSGGLPHGTAIEYSQNGSIKYNGTFTTGLYNGDGVLYNENGTKLYSGTFEMGTYCGNGVMYDNGEKLYTGEFENGLYNGNGTLYGDDGSVTVGSFTDGEISGVAERTYIDGMKYEGCFEEEIPDGAGSLSNVTGSFVYSGMFQDGDFDYSRFIGQESAVVAQLIPSLSQRIESDCFYLEDNDFGIAIRFSFATESTPAVANEVFSRPFSGSELIKNASDIKAPSAKSVSETDRILPTWADKKFGISANSLKCYAAVYDSVTVYYWVDKNSNMLMLKSADGTIISGGTGNGQDTNDIGLTYEEIVELFEEIGLDIEDFASIGF